MTSKDSMNDTHGTEGVKQTSPAMGGCKLMAAPGSDSSPPRFVLASKPQGPNISVPRNQPTNHDRPRNRLQWHMYALEWCGHRKLHRGACSPFSV